MKVRKFADEKKRFFIILFERKQRTKKRWKSTDEKKRFFIILFERKQRTKERRKSTDEQIYFDKICVGKGKKGDI